MRKENDAGEAKHYEEKLDTTPKLIPEKFEETTRIDFGNSGFTLWLDREESGSVIGSFDYMPEGVDRPGKGKQATYAKVFISSIYALYKFVNDPRTEKDFGFNPKKIEKVGSFSNKVFIDSVCDFFDRHEGSGLVQREEELGLSIDVSALSSLEDDHPFINYLKTVSESESTKSITLSRGTTS
jgi:hypothetical protein